MENLNLYIILNAMRDQCERSLSASLFNTLYNLFEIIFK